MWALRVKAVVGSVTPTGVIAVAPHSERPRGAAQGCTCYTFCSLCSPVRWGLFRPTLQM